MSLVTAAMGRSWMFDYTDLGVVGAVPWLEIG